MGARKVICLFQLMIFSTMLWLSYIRWIWLFSRIWKLCFTNLCLQDVILEVWGIRLKFTLPGFVHMGSQRHGHMIGSLYGKRLNRLSWINNHSAILFQCQRQNCLWIFHLLGCNFWIFCHVLLLPIFGYHFVNRINIDAKQKMQSIFSKLLILHLV